MGHHHNPAFEDFSHAGRSVGNADALAAAAPSLVDRAAATAVPEPRRWVTTAAVAGRLGGSLLAVLVARRSLAQPALG